MLRKLHLRQVRAAREDLARNLGRGGGRASQYRFQELPPMPTPHAKYATLSIYCVYVLAYYIYKYCNIFKQAAFNFNAQICLFLLYCRNIGTCACCSNKRKNEC